MDSFQNHEWAFDLEFYKRFCFYQMFDPNTKTIFNHNVYRVLHGIILLILLCSLVYFCSGYFMDGVDEIDYVEVLMVMTVCTTAALYLIKFTVIYGKTNEVWNLLPVTRVDFLTSRLCRNQLDVLHERRAKSVRIINLLNSFALCAYTAWLIFPLASGLTTTVDPNKRTQIILNFPFPLTKEAFDKYYWLFYVWELLLGYVLLFYSAIFDTFVMSLCWVIMGQYDVLTQAFNECCVEDEKKNAKNGKTVYKSRILFLILIEEGKKKYGEQKLNVKSKFIKTSVNNRKKKSKSKYFSFDSDRV